MKTNPLSRKISAALLAYLCAAPVLSPAAAVPEGVWVRDGYQLSVAVDTLSAPRFLAIGLNGTLFVSVPKEGKIYACTDADGDGTFEKQTTFIEGKDPKNIPQGIQWHDGSLWYAQLNSIAKARDTNGDGKADEDIEVLGEAQLPTGSRGGHMWRALLIHKGRIYTHVGDQSNATDEPIEASERKKIWSFALDGSDPDIPLQSQLKLKSTHALVLAGAIDKAIVAWTRLNSRDRTRFITRFDSMRVYGHYQEILGYLSAFGGEENRIDVAQVLPSDEPLGADDSPNRV